MSAPTATGVNTALIIVANNNVYTRMSTRQKLAYFDTVVEPSPAAALPVVTMPTPSSCVSTTTGSKSSTTRMATLTATA
ncbi:MAG: hypothetical protein R3E50_14505 [Halioglobus sp.]